MTEFTFFRFFRIFCEILGWASVATVFAIFLTLSLCTFLGIEEENG